MNCLVAICLLGLAASARASGLGLGLGGPVYAPGHASADYYSYPKYAFDYAVKDPHTGDNKAQWEKRDGDVVKGAYSLVEPDGSLRVVEYYADDKSGFNAVVKRIGPNIHPSGHGIAPIYKAPIPILAKEPIGIAPYSIGPVANLGRLAHAPLLSGPYGGHGAISTASLIKEDIPIVSAPIIPIVKPIIAEPIGHGYEPYPIAPIIKSPLLLPWGGYKQPLLVGGGYNKVPLAPLDYLGNGLGLGNGLLTKVPYESSWRGGYGKQSYYD